MVQLEHKHGWHGTLVLCFSHRTSTCFTSMIFCSPLISKISDCEPSRPHQNFQNSLRETAIWSCGCYYGSDGYTTPRGVVGFVFLQ